VGSVRVATKQRAISNEAVGEEQRRVYGHLTPPVNRFDFLVLLAGPVNSLPVFHRRSVKINRRKAMIYEYTSFLPLIYELLLLIPSIKLFTINFIGVSYYIFICCNVFIRLLSFGLILKGFTLFLQKDKKKCDFLWLILLCNQFTFPVYWYFNVVKK
jgi:hypothetical protein